MAIGAPRPHRAEHLDGRNRVQLDVKLPQI
jgi:hypothetical protein